MENDKNIQKILYLADKIIKSKFSKECEILFFSYLDINNNFELFIRHIEISGDFLRDCCLKNIKFGVIIIKYKNLKQFNELKEMAKNIYSFSNTLGVKIKCCFILKENKYIGFDII